MRESRASDAALQPRIERVTFAPAGTPAGDYVEGVSAARALLRPAGPARDAAIERRPNTVLGEGSFTVSSASAAAKLTRILAGEGEFVSTGQQPGLFLGPLYSVYKAITAVRVAEDRERRTGRPTLALFWVAADDHDWAEVAACRTLGPDERLEELRVAAPVGREESSVGETTLPGRVEQELARLRASIRGPATGALAPWFGELEAAYRPGTTFAAAFIRSLAAALAGLDIVLLDSSDPFVRAAAADVYRQVIRAPERVVEAMSDGRKRLEDAGYQPGLTPPPTGLQVFFDGGGGRRHVLATEGGFDLGDGATVARGVLEALLAEKPGAFTPAAALRPVLESRLLPVAATVLGPGEMGYWAQLPRLFSALGAAFPEVHPRDGWLLVEPAVDHMLRKLDLTATDVADRGDGLSARWIDGARPAAVADALDEAKAAIRSAFARLDDATAGELPGVRSAVAKASHEAKKSIAGLTKTIDAHVARRETIALAQVGRLNAHLRPGGQPQERTIAAAQFLGRYGAGLVAALLASSRVAGAEGRG